MSSYTTAILITRYSIQPAKVQELNAIFGSLRYFHF